MQVFVSKQNKTSIYHKRGCHYINRIKARNLITTISAEAVNSGYCSCAYCGGLEGEIRIETSRISSLEEQYEIKTSYNRYLNTFYVRTSHGFWKIVESADDEMLLLFHANRFSPAKTDAELKLGDFHIQKEIHGFKALHDLIYYCIFHDEARGKRIEHEKKERKRQALSTAPLRSRKRKRHKESLGSYKYISSLFDSLERQSPEIKAMSVW